MWMGSVASVHSCTHASGTMSGNPRCLTHHTWHANFDARGVGSRIVRTAQKAMGEKPWARVLAPSKAHSPPLSPLGRAEVAAWIVYGTKAAPVEKINKFGTVLQAHPIAHPRTIAHPAYPAPRPSQSRNSAVN